MEFISENSTSEPIKTETKGTCVNIQLNSGAYQIVVLNIFAHIKENDYVNQNSEGLKCIRNEERHDKNGHKVENLMYFETEEIKVQMHTSIIRSRK